jgi:MoxR-like ATPase
LYIRPVNCDDMVAFQRLVRRVPVAEAVMRYALHLVRTSRPKSAQAPESVKKYVAFGARVRPRQIRAIARDGGAAPAIRAPPLARAAASRRRIRKDRFFIRRLLRLG